MEDDMTNKELLDYTGPKNLLTQMEGQRRYVLTLERGPFQCPNCGTPHAKWEINGISDVNDYDMGHTHGDHGVCKACHRALRYVVYLTGGSSLELEPDPSLASTQV